MSNEDLKAIVEELEKKADWWRRTTDDPHQISVAVYVALSEVKNAIIDAMAK